MDQIKLFIMKKIIVILLLSMLITTISAQTIVDSQQDPTKREVIIIKNDGAKFRGYIISQDAREILMDGVAPFGKIFIPLHTIREIRDVDSGSGTGYNLFSSRYFLTTNGLGMTKGSKYSMLNYYGPEAHFAVSDDFTIGVMTTWAAIPLVGSFKYSIHLDDNFHISLGSLIGTLSWIKLDAAGILGYGSFTIGNYENNLNLSLGYAGVTYENEGGGAPLFSIACLFRLGDNLHFVGDSFFYFGENPFTVIVPGLRFERPMKRSSIQIGIGGVIAEGETIPVPVPVFGWFYDL